MAFDPPPVAPPRSPRSRAARWLPVAAGALALLAASQALWLWQTWPVRELLAPPVQATPVASGR